MDILFPSFFVADKLCSTGVPSEPDKIAEIKVVDLLHFGKGPVFHEDGFEPSGKRFC